MNQNIEELQEAIRLIERRESNASKGDSNGNVTSFARIVELMSYSDKPICKVRQRLLDEGYSVQDAEDGIQKAIAYGYLDDIRFGTSLVRKRIKSGKGQGYIERELESIDICPTDISGWPNEFFGTHENQVDAALKIITAKPPHAKNARQAAYGSLIRRGYSQAVAYEAARIWVNSQ